jgi:hypothetical protein
MPRASHNAQVVYRYARVLALGARAAAYTARALAITSEAVAFDLAAKEAAALSEDVTQELRLLRVRTALHEGVGWGRAAQAAWVGDWRRRAPVCGRGGATRGCL